MKFFLLVLAVLLTSCSKDHPLRLDESSNTKSKDNIQESLVSKELASSIANIYLAEPKNGKDLKANSIKGSRIISKRTIKTIEPVIFDDNSATSMYLINYHGGGFVIVSATKEYYPILAYSEDNSLNITDLDKLNVGLSIWKGETQEAIMMSKNLSEPEKSKMRSLWTALEMQVEGTSADLNKSNYTYEQYMRFYARMSQLYPLAPGYSFGPLSSAQSFLTQTEYNNLVTIANNYGSPLECTIVGYKRRPVQEVGPLIGTSWHQGNSFHDLIPNKPAAGCVAIAMAQIMKYHQYPQTYNWFNMPNTIGTSDTQQLIYDIGLATDMDYGEQSGTYLSNTRDAFTSFGYSVTQKNHAHMDVENEILLNNRPVFMAGDRTGILNLISWNGHAWVCEGARKIDETVNYFVEYQMIDGSYSSIGGPSLSSPISSSGFSSLYFYLNWGWGTNNGNGWFVHNNVTTPLGSYHYDRKNIYVHPNP